MSLPAFRFICASLVLAAIGAACGSKAAHKRQGLQDSTSSAFVGDPAAVKICNLLKKSGLLDASGNTSRILVDVQTAESETNYPKDGSFWVNARCGASS